MTTSAFRSHGGVRQRQEYNFDLMEFPSAEAPGISVFYRDKTGAIFHTYSAYAGGTENAVNTYNNLDLVSNGRDEDGLYPLTAWLRHHDRYNSRIVGHPEVGGRQRPRRSMKKTNGASPLLL